VDYLKNEITGKPVSIVSYGVQGGKFASEQLSGVLGGMDLLVSKTRPVLTFSGGAGPDAFQAMSQGSLGDASRKEWEAEVPTLFESFKEVIDALASKKD
jgi:NAD(P)H-dependent FMN reductase